MKEVGRGEFIGLTTVNLIKAIPIGCCPYLNILLSPLVIGRIKDVLPPWKMPVSIFPKPVNMSGNLAKGNWSSK